MTRRNFKTSFKCTAYSEGKPLTIICTIIVFSQIQCKRPSEDHHCTIGTSDKQNLTSLEFGNNCF